MAGGWIKLHRAIFESPEFESEPLCRLAAFAWLVANASIRPRERRVGSVTVWTERGQLAVSLSFLAKAWRWDRSKVQRFLKALQSRYTIGVETDTGVTLITICNYSEYQDHETDTDTAAIQRRYSSDTNHKKGRREEGKKPPVVPLAGDATQSTMDLGDTTHGDDETGAAPDHKAGREPVEAAAESGKRAKRRSPAKPVAEDWRPSAEQFAKLTAEHGPRGVDIEHELRQFRLHAQAHDRRLARPGAAFALWCGKAVARSPGGASQGPRGRPGFRDALATPVVERGAPAAMADAGWIEGQTVSGWRHADHATDTGRVAPADPADFRLVQLHDARARRR